MMLDSAGRGSHVSYMLHSHHHLFPGWDPT
jgi:hypothetical protein